MIDKIKDLIITYENNDEDDIFNDEDGNYDIGTDQYLVQTKDDIYYGYFYVWHDKLMPYDWGDATGRTIREHLLKNPGKTVGFLDLEIDTLGHYTCEVSDIIDVARVEDAFININKPE